MVQNSFKSKGKISKVEVTDDTLTGRGGLALFVRYLSRINIYEVLLGSFAPLRRSKKGQPIWNIFKQVFCFFYDGTSRHLSYFDQLKEEEGYAAVASLNFEDALQKIHRTLPDRVLIDVVMPDITGFDACRKIKATFQPHPPLVIIMTGKLDAVDPILARKMGADDFVVKTSDMAVLVRAVQKILPS